MDGHAHTHAQTQLSFLFLEARDIQDKQEDGWCNEQKSACPGKHRTCKYVYWTACISKLHTIENPRQYADAVDSYSKLSATNCVYAGPHYENLAAYLQLLFELRAPDRVPKKSNNQVKDDYKFVSLCDLDPTSPKRIRHISNINEFEAEFRG
jgi:hypothetical protein